MRIIVSLISHNQKNMIISLGALKLLASDMDVVVICRDNIADSELEKYCFDNNIYYVCNDKPYGFAKNNNLNYEYYKSLISPKENDWFLLLNPDVKLLNDTIISLKKSAIKYANKIITANLFLDDHLENQDDNLRKYPNFINFIRTYLKQDRSTMIDRSHGIPEYLDVWASGAFLLIRSEHYAMLGGLDEKYYMYCEDIDFCLRAKKIGVKTILDTDVKAVHYRQRASKKIFSNHFFWHVSSVLKYCFCSKGVMSKKTCVAKVLHDSER